MRNDRSIIKPVTALLLLIVIITALIVNLPEGTVYHPDPENAAEIEANVSALRAVEQMEPADLNAVKKEREKAERAARNGIMVDDLAAERQKILSLEGVTKAQLRKWFADAAICGDSIAEAVSGYGWLDRSTVFAKIGIRISADTEVVKKAVAKRPSVMFFVFGVNDIENYKEDYSIFINRYTACIENVKAELPDTAIYVHAIFPPKTIGKKKFYNYLDQYNDALERMCADLGVFYVDGSFIIQAKPEFYEPDQVHMGHSFYPYWLTYLADIAGLTADEKE